MSKAEEVKFPIKVVVNKEKTKVLLVEAGSDFTDVLLSFLLLPLGTIVKVLKKHYGDEAPAVGSLTTLYNGVANLDSIYFERETYKKTLLNPPCYNDSKLSELRFNVNCSQPTSLDFEKSYDGVFTQSLASFIISDDLRVVPNMVGSITETLSSLGIAATDIDGSEMRNVTFGLNEIMALWKESLISINPLTALLFPGSRMNLETKRHVSLHRIYLNVMSANPRKMILKATLQKSTKKLLFAYAGQDFVTFLFRLLFFPLGKVEWFLGSNTGLKTKDNLHRSVAHNFQNMHLKNPKTKDLLINSSYHDTSNEFSFLNFTSTSEPNYVKEVSMYMVSDDLTVSPLGITSCLSCLNGLKISLTDVEELELQVGLEEGLRIMKAALTSTTALTDGLIKPFLKKQAHQETSSSRASLIRYRRNDRSLNAEYAAVTSL